MNQLLLLSVSGFFRRLRYDLARELTVAICALALGATFFYIFQDFINIQIRALSQSMHEFFASATALALSLGANYLAIRINRREQAQNPYRNMAAYLGDSDAVLRRFVVSRQALVILICLLPAHGLAYLYLLSWPVYSQLILLVVNLILSAVALFLPVRVSEARDKDPIISVEGQNTLLVMISWRMRQMLLRNRQAQFACLLSGIFLLISIGAVFLGAPELLHFLCALAAGLLVSMALSAQLAEDLKSVWIERNLGISHEQFISTYRCCAASLGGLIGGVGALGLLFAWPSSTLAAGLFALKMFAVSMVCPLVTPSMMLQVDGRRPIIQFIIMTLMGLFLGTAVFAHWASLLLIPIIIYYGDQMQHGRYYRA